MIWNWEILYYIFRGLPTPQETIVLIHHDYLNPGNWFNLILIPLLIITISFLACAPWLHETYDRWKEWTHAKMMKFAPRFQWEFNNLKTKYDTDLETLKAAREAGERELTKTIINEREESKTTIENLRRDLKTYQAARTLREGYNVNLNGTNYSAFDLVQANDGLNLTINLRNETIKELRRDIEILQGEKAELSVLLEEKRKK